MQIDKFNVGDIVYIKSDSDKCKARDKYIVISMSAKSAELRKFTSMLFRKQSYTVPLHDILPVRSTTLRAPPSHATSLCIPNDNAVINALSVYDYSTPPAGNAHAPQSSPQPAPDFPLHPLVPQELPCQIAPSHGNLPPGLPDEPINHTVSTPVAVSSPSTPPEPPDDPVQSDSSDDETIQCSRPQRIRRPPIWQKDYITD